MKATIVFQSPSFDPLVIDGENIQVVTDSNNICTITSENKEQILIFNPDNILYVHKNLTE